MSKESEAKTRVIHRKPAATHEGPAGGASPVVFHCPNGHRIAVSAGLAGKRGKCSKCGVVVEIPAAPPEAQPAATAPGPAAEPLAPLAETAEFAVAPATSGGTAEPDTGGTDEPWDFIGGPAEEAGWAPDLAAEQEFDGGHPTASLIARLWAERAHGGVIELHLANGSVILPEWYDANWSRGSHGLFASQAADGTVTLTAVAWETVQKVIVRKLTAVPDDMFR